MNDKRHDPLRLLFSTPGELLRHEFMEPLDLSAYALAQILHVPTNCITAILNGNRTISADTALWLARREKEARICRQLKPRAT